jgi:geranyl-CoA carboxylase alpha subunit
MALSKILVANRGEIAVRVITTARALGYRTVAVYSDADAGARHVDLADEAVRIGPAAVQDSYLDPARLLDAARVSGADAVHPGYGFLSENAAFARACEAAGIIFIGPPADAIELMGSKRLSKIAMIAAGVPCIPGYQDSDQSDARLVKEAKRIGFPLMVKASAGGGGRGMRLVHGADALEDAIRAARSEAQNAFGSGELILERAVIEPRHIEVQVFADAHGNVIHLGERDCSVQRRHQKVVEEAPSPFVTDDLRARMGAAAVGAARACNYRGAGTVEFLVDANRDFYFLEMNTRLQVEHPVTELITGQDLVAWQIDVAAGKPLPLRQDQVERRGWAMEVRVYAEDPRSNFMPQTGTIAAWETPDRPHIRIDHGISAGQVVSAHYDPMLAKIIAWGKDRDEARRKLASAVDDTLLLGVNNNLRFLSAILRDDVFAAGGATTAFLDTDFAAQELLSDAPPSLETLGLAATLMLLRADGAARAGWGAASDMLWRFRLLCEGRTHDLTLSIDDAGAHRRVTARAGDAESTFDLVRCDADRIVIVAGGVRRTVRYAAMGETLFLGGPLGSIGFTDVTHAPAASADAVGSGRVIASMDGAIVAVLVAAGEHVSKGQPVVLLEAMKMEHRLVSDVDGVVQSVATRTGAQVKIRQLLVTIAPHDQAPE